MICFKYVINKSFSCSISDDIKRQINDQQIDVSCFKKFPSKNHFDIELFCECNKPVRAQLFPKIIKYLAPAL